MPHSQEMTRRARELRKKATSEERKLWYEFLRGHPARFRRQQPVGLYILDFYCPAARLAIELDGGGHYESEQMEYDQKRDLYLNSQNIRVLRFTNLEIRRDFSGVCETIDRNVPPSVSLTADSSPARGEPKE